MLVGTLCAAAAALRLPEQPTPMALDPAPTEPALPAVAPVEPPTVVAAELDPGEALDDLWDRIDVLRARGAVCGGRPLPPVQRLKGSAPLDAAAAAQATGETPEARVKAAKFRGKLAREVVARGQRTPAEVVRWWLESPPHCEALMTPLASHGGASVVADPEGGGYVWVVVLGRKRQAN